MMSRNNTPHRQVSWIPSDQEKEKTMVIQDFGQLVGLAPGLFDQYTGQFRSLVGI